MLLGVEVELRKLLKKCTKFSGLYSEYIINDDYNFPERFS